MRVLNQYLKQFTSSQRHWFACRGVAWVLPGVLMLAAPTLGIPEVIAQEVVSDRKAEADRLSQQAVEQYRTSQFREALQSLEQALVIYQEIGNRQGEGTALTGIGLMYDNLGEYEQALDYYQQSLAIVQEIGDHSSEGDSLNNIGAIYRRLGEYERALDYYQQSLTILQEIGDRRGEGDSLNNIGVVHDSLGEYERALDYYEQSLTIRQEIGDRPGEGVSLNNIGGVYSSLGEYERALDYYQQSLAISQEIGNRAGEGISLNNIGLVYSSLGEYERALDYYQQSLAIRQEIGDRPGEGISLNSIGAVYDSLGEYEQALDYSQQSLAIRQEIGDRSGEGVSLNNIGAVYSSLGEYERALDYYQQSLAIRQEIGDRAGEGTTLSNIGYLLADQDQPELAILFLKQSVNVSEAIRDDIRGLSQDQQQSFTDTIAGTYRELADLLLRQNRIPEAQRVLDLLKVQELDDYLQDVRSTAQTESGVGYWAIEAELLALYQQVLDEATELKQLQEQSRDQGYDSLSSSEQQRLTELQNRSGDLQDVFFTFRDRPEVEAAIDRIRDTTQGQNLELDSYAQLQSELQALPQRAAVLYPLILDDRLELVLIFPDAPPFRFPVSVESEELNGAIVEFGQALTSPRSRLDSRGIESIAQTLYGWLVEPLEEALAQQNIETIIYSPDGALRYIPLAALHDGENYLAQRFSINHITADSLTNLTDPPPGNRQLLAAACAECSFAFNVAANTFQFNDLPFTETEVNNLAKQFSGTSVLVNQDFSRDALQNRLGSYSVIHLATHAAFVDNAPHESFLVFGSEERISLQDIRRRWNLNHVELVVLSACQTAVGSAELGSGIEFLGLGYQIQQSGAQSVIASLWNVSDGGTQVLMDAFYAALNNGYTKAEALQRAQQALITSDATVLEGERGVEVEIIDTRTGQRLSQSSDLSHPYYWAPFILIGNGL